MTRNETRQVDGQGHLKQRRVLTYDVTLLEGSPYQRLIARDDKPLSSAEERVYGQDAWIIDATPRPGFRPKSRLARLFPKFKGRLWIDKQDSVWVKVEAEALDSISIGVFLARLQKGARMTFEQTRVNDEVWLPKRVTIALAARILLLKSLRAEVEATFMNYRKFQSESRLVGFEPPQ